jgi:probable selenium-dependent hydroxylase accessory protein YqeC
VALAGAGGKTTLAYRLAREAREAGLSVIVTTTTHMGTLPGETTGPIFTDAEGQDLEAIARAVRAHGRATVLGRRVRADKLEGLEPHQVDALRALADLVVVEADGARGRSLKAPRSHEPVVPETTTLLVAVAALDVLGTPLSEERVHRLEEVQAATGLATGAAVDEAAVAATLVAPAGYLRHFGAGRPGRRGGVFLNKAETPAAWVAAARIAARVRPPYDFVVAGSARGGAVEGWP